MNKIVILNDSVQLYEHYISDDRWEKTLAFPRGGLTYLISNGTIKFFAFEDYLYRNTLMSMQLPVHVIDDYAGIDADLSDMDELTEALDRLFPTNDIDAELDGYLTKDEAQETYQLKGDYVTTEELADVIDDYYTKDETDDLLDNKLDASAYTPTDLSNYYTKGETNEAISAAIDEAVSGKADTSAVTAVSDALTAHTSDSGIHVSQEEKDAWNAKLDASAYTPTDLSDYAKKEDIPSLDGYATEQWVNNKRYLTSDYLKGIKETSGSHTVSLSKTSSRPENIVFGGDVDAKLENYNKIIMRCLLPIKGAFNSIYTDEVTGRDSVNGLMATRYNYAIGQWNERDDGWEGSENYFSIGDGTSDANRHNIFTILRDGTIKLSDGRLLQGWMDYIDNNYATQEWVNNQDYLTEHQPLKTINGESLVGDGNIVISGGGGGDMSNYYNKGEVDTALGTKQDTLVSGTNIKTINNQSILGNGNIEIQGGVSSGDVQTIVNQSISSITSDVTNIQNQVANLSIALNQCCSGTPTPTPTPIYRTYSGSPYCDGYDKYVETVYQVSYDSGSTWQNISSPEQVLVEHNSLDCGYVAGTKITLTNEAGDTKTVDCDGKPLIKSETVMRSALCIPKTAVIGDCVTEIAEGAFEGDDCVVDITMPDSVDTIGNYAFGSCHNLSAITLSTGLTSIGISLFENCEELTTMPALPAVINTIPSGTFRKSGLQGSLVIPSTIREIGSTAFWNCTGLTSVYMNSVTIINDLAFSGCTSLQSITINQTLPPAVGNNTKCFDDTNNCPIYVPANRVDLYKQTSGLSKYADRIQAIQ